MENELFKKEYKIKVIGGALKADYMLLKRYVIYLNRAYFKLLLNLWLTDSKKLLIELILNDFRGLKEAYISNVIKKVKKGKIPKEKFLSKNTQELCENLPPEEREKVEAREIHRNLTYKYREIYESFFNWETEYIYSPKALEICSKAIIITKQGIGIDGEKFIKIYRDYIGADQSITGQKHREAAEAINAFFNGLEITEKELFKYFTIVKGKLEPNLKSVNSDSYLKFGKRSEEKGKGILELWGQKEES